MRRLIAALGAASLISILVVGATFAATDITIAEGGIIADCATTQTGEILISGTVEVTDGSGTFDLVLMGNSAGGSMYDPIPGQVYNVDASAGPGTYTYEFTLSAAVAGLYKSFRVDAAADASGATVNPEKSLSFNIDTCTDVIPEVPAAVLLLITGGIGAAFFAARRMRSHQQSVVSA